ncbi:MAG: hypothetical protein AAFP86_08485, partial [Planctomycetota bacterium]
MRIDRSVVTGLACGLSLVLALSIGRPSTAEPQRSEASGSASRWTSVLLQQHGVRTAGPDTDGPRVLCLDDSAGTLARALASDDARLGALCRSLVWAAPDAGTGARLGIATAPHLLLVEGDPPAVLDACEPVAGARPNVGDVIAALARFADGKEDEAGLLDALRIDMDLAACFGADERAE